MTATITRVEVDATDLRPGDIVVDIHGPGREFAAFDVDTDARVGAIPVVLGTAAPARCSGGGCGVSPLRTR